MNAHGFRPILRRHNLAPLIAFFSLSLAASFGFAASGARPQDGGGEAQARFGSGLVGLRQEALSNHDRAVKKPSWPNEVVKITRLKVKKGEVEFDKKFAADDDWLRGLTLTVKNVSDKPVVFVEATVTLFGRGGEDETGKVPLEFPFTYGSDPAADVRDVSRLPRALDPGDSADMALSEEGYTRLRQMLLRENYPLKFKQAEVAIERVFFSDGMMWYKSYYFLRDPDNPNRWLRDKHFKKVGRS